MRQQPSAHVERIPARGGVHGGIDFDELERLGISPQDVIDFSVSINPFGPPPGIGEALTGVRVDRYPDPEATELKRALAIRLGVSPEKVLAASGSTELFRVLATAYFGPGDRVIIPEPTYGDYEIACHLSGARILKASMLGEPDFRLNVPGLVGLIREYGPGGIFLCNPNNPTGQYLPRQDVSKIVYEAGGGLVVLDEAYVAFTADPWPSTELLDMGNVVIVRSMTKDYALAGLRLGYAVAPEPVIAVLKRVIPPWSVSSVAQAAGLVALGSEGYLEECGRKLRESRGFLLKGLQGLGLSPMPSEANFFLVKVGDAAGFRKALLTKGIIVRDCTSFGLPEYIRLAPRTIPECERLLEAIRETNKMQRQDGDGKTALE
jgi:histidinol-phosphate aminotransferase